MPVGGRARLHDRLGARLLGLFERHLHDRVQRLALLDVPGHVAGRVADRLRGRREPDQPAELVDVAGLGRRAQHPALQLVLQLVGPRLEHADLGGERPVVEQDRGVREPDRRLGEVFHLHQDVDRAIELGQRGRVAVGGHRHRRGARQLPDEVHAFLGPAHEQHVAAVRRCRRRPGRTPSGCPSGSPSPTCRSRSAARARAASGRWPARRRARGRGRSSRRRGAGRAAARRGCRDGPRSRARRRTPPRRSAGSRRRSTAPRPCPRRPRGCAPRASPSCAGAAGARRSARPAA